MRTVLIPFLLFFISCNRQTIKQVDNYYFQVSDFFVERTFCYVNQTDTSEKALWKMQTILSNHDTLFQTTILNNGKLSERLTEKIHNGNSKIISYTLYNEGNESVCSIIDSMIYEANQKMNEQIKWSVTFQDFYSTNIFGLTKVRKLKSLVNDKKIFSDEMQVDIIGTSNNYKYSVESVYQKGKGLISYKITRPNGQVKDFKYSDEK